MINLKRPLFGAIGAAAIAITLAACGTKAEDAAKATTGAQASKAISVVDCLGRTVTLDRPAQRIAYTHFASAEALKILGAWDLVVARDGYTSDSLVYPGLDKIPALGPKLGNGFEPNMELLLSSDVDLLVLEEIPMPGLMELIAKVEDSMAVVVLKTYDPSGIEASMRALGALVGKETRAEDFLSWYGSTRDAIVARTAGIAEADKVRMFYKTGYGAPEDIMTFSDELSYVPERNRITGCVNVAADLPSQGGWVISLDGEWLTRQDIDVMIYGDPVGQYYGLKATDTAPLEAYRQAVMALPVFAHTDAVKNNRVYMQDPSFFGTPRFIVGFSYMAKIFYPDRLAGIDTDAIHKEYLTRFLGLDEKTASGGIFIYPKD